jgi:aspartyl-tRNA(Asn)/glutamyl-tRNA(Gln) amidotransferase subunit C
MAGAQIDRALVLHVAKLSSLLLHDSEVDRFAGELRRIVSHVEQLDTLDTKDVPPTAHVQLDRAPWRSDDIQCGLTHDDALSQAPAVEAEGFAVPPFVE